VGWLAPMGPQPQAQGWPEGCQPLSVQQAGRWPAIPQMPAPVRALASMRVQVQAQMQQPAPSEPVQALASPPGAPAGPHGQAGPAGFATEQSAGPIAARARFVPAPAGPHHCHCCLMHRRRHAACRQTVFSVRS
jgi:hypothetical protein